MTNIFSFVTPELMLWAMCGISRLQEDNFKISAKKKQWHLCMMTLLLALLLAQSRGLCGIDYIVIAFAAAVFHSCFLLTHCARMCPNPDPLHITNAPEHSRGVFDWL